MDLQKQFEFQGNWLFKYRGILPLIILIAGIAILIFSELDAFQIEKSIATGKKWSGCIVYHFFAV
ncbi:MAG: hypothetical protein LBC68_03245 [Prevotellaceae bacterium]|jgi:hypothetical protein|nr:hypothetical protein [Prevotellaceae bacterium]